MSEEAPKFGYTVKETSSRPIRRPIGMRCSECGSEDVQVKAYCYWDKDEQAFAIDEVDWDWSWCNACADESCIDEYNL